MPRAAKIRETARANNLIPAALIDAITEHIADRHSTITDDDALIIALLIIHTYFYMDCPTTTYLYIVAVIDAGKSVIARIFRDLCFMPQILHPTVASLSIFRQSGKHTAIIDEIQDFVNARSTDIDSLYALFNLGYEPGNTWQVSAIGRPGETDDRDPFCPKIFLGIEPNIFRETTASRCILINVEPGNLDDQYERARRQTIRPVAKYAENIKARLVALAANSKLRAKLKTLAFDITPIRINDGLTIFNREADIWRPLIIIADLASAEYGKRIRAIVADRANTEPEHIPTQAELADTALRKLMREKKLTAFNWRHGKSCKPLLNDGWPMSNADFGWPRPTGGLRGRLPECSLLINPKIESAELRFKSTDFTEICTAIGWKRADVLRAYRLANRLHAQQSKDRTRSTIPLPFISGHGDETIIAIDISQWIWPDAPIGTVSDKWLARALSETDNPWKDE